MPWQEVVSIMSMRAEFVGLAESGQVTMSELCRRFGISRKTGYKWLERAAEGDAELADRSRRPLRSPRRTSAEIEQEVVRLRRQHPAWGPRKLRHVLIERRRRKLGRPAGGPPEFPAVSTVAAILERHGLIEAVESEKRERYIRFEHPDPNDLWQMDYKGHFPIGTGRCHPLTVLDDHSRYSLVLRACDNERGETVHRWLVEAFRRYGLPLRMTMDNGSPWGDDERPSLTPLTAWLLRLGVAVSHSRPYHPQTQGKDERFHRSLKAEVVSRRHFADLAAAQKAFDRWRPIYNTVRPHEGIQMQTPAQRYRPSPRPYPEQLPALEYASQDAVRKVQAGGEVHFRGRTLHVSKALRGQLVALRPTTTDGQYEIYFGRLRLTEIDLLIQARA